MQKWQNSANANDTRVSPDDKINVIIGNGDDHIWHIVWGVQMAFHSRPDEETNRSDKSGAELCEYYGLNCGIQMIM